MWYFKEYLFKENTINNILPNDWWKYIRLNDSRQKDIIEGLMGAKSSSAGVERIFSAFGLIQSKLRNRKQ